MWFRLMVREMKSHSSLIVTVCFDRIACGLFAVLAFAAMCLPDLCIIYNADGSAFVFVGIIVDPPTGEAATSEVYSSAPLVLLLVIGAVYYWFRATRVTKLGQPEYHAVPENDWLVP
jgi:hypothetical protein